MSALRKRDTRVVGRGLSGVRIDAPLTVADFAVIRKHPYYSARILRDVEGLNIQETVQAVGGSAVSVRVHLSAARRKIRDRIKLRYPELLERSS